ncbi:NADPH dehydrogenase [Streptomyces tendae]
MELHGAHGYLIDQFLWAGTNRRTDAYGGDPVARTRFAVEIVQAVRSAVSPGFPVVFRFSQWKADHYDARLAETPEELEAILTPLAHGRSSTPSTRPRAATGCPSSTAPTSTWPAGPAS